MFFNVLFDIIFIIVIAAAAVVDIRKKRIPNIISLCALVPSILKIVHFLCKYNDNFIVFFSDMAGGLLIVLLFIGIPYLVNKSIGGGDLKLAAASGLYIGFKGTLTFMCIAFITCAFWCVGALIYNKLKKLPKPQALPFAPFLLIGTIFSYIA